MSLSIERRRLFAACEKVRRDLLAERGPQGHWVGRLSSSPTATATAISALVIAEQYGSPEQHGRTADRLFDADQIFQSDLSELIVQSLHWLACHQNEDGGWGDTELSRSEPSATLLVNAAFHLTGVPAKYSGLLERTEMYIRQQGGIAAIRKRHESEKPLVAAISANCALAGLIPWKEVPSLPFELAAVPQAWPRVLKLLGIRYSLPELVAVGQARFHHAQPLNPIDRALRRLSRQRALKALEQMQPESGGFVEGVPLTSFIVMSLASIGLAEHQIVRRGVEFLLANVRGDGSWPLHASLAVRNTALAAGALRPRARGRISGGFEGTSQDATYDGSAFRADIEWLLSCQRTTADAYSRAAPGGWSWTDSAGGIPDAEDTSQVLLALAQSAERVDLAMRRRIDAAAKRGVRWLLSLQNEDGGWPTCCRGAGLVLLQRSSTDVTAQALRALAACRKVFVAPSAGRGLAGQLDRAVQAGLAYLRTQQREDGSWVPLWFGNQDNPHDENPVCGTARVLISLADLGYDASEAARRGGDWLCRMQHVSGGWGPIVRTGKPSWRTALRRPPDSTAPHEVPDHGPSVEETSLAMTALARLRGHTPGYQSAAERGLAWLVDAVENDRHREPAPIGLHFGRLWYYERLYPIVFAVEALDAAATELYAGRDESYAPAPLQAALR